MNNVYDEDLYIEDENNPTVISPTCDYGISFYQTRESLIDVEQYKSFIENAISSFRHITPFYKNYKSYLMGLGLNHCQVLHNVNEENVGAKGIELNHNFLTIFDIALLITEHILNTVGYISTFDLIYLLKYEHAHNRIPIVMLSQTVHQMYHANPDMMFGPDMCFGYWVDLLARYNRGLTPKLCQKIIRYIDISINDPQLNADTINNLLSLKDNIEGWERFNDQMDSAIYSTNSTNNYPYNSSSYYMPDYQ